MASDVIGFPYSSTGSTLYALIRDINGNIADVTTDLAFETYSTAALGDYDVALTEQGTASRYYTLTFPSWVAAGNYYVAIYERAGGSPAEGDAAVWFEEVQWTGSAILPRSTVNTTVNSILTDTAEIGSAGAGLTALATAANLATVDTVVDGIKAVTDNLPDSGALTTITTNVAAILVDTAEIGAAGAGLTAVPWNAAWDAEVQSEVNDGLVALGLDHLVAASVAGTDITDDSIVAKLVSSSATADWDSYVNTTDSLQALRDWVGDGTNLTEAGGTGDQLTALATAANLATVDTVVDAILVDTGTTLPATLATAQADLDTLTGADGVTLATSQPNYAPYTGSPPTAVQIRTELDSNSTQLAAILADTAEIGVAGAGLTALTVDVTKINGSAAAAVRLGLSTGQIIPGTVDTVTNGHTPTTTEFQADDITEATADHYNGRVILFTSGALAGQATSISDYAAVGGIGQFTVVALTEAPANDDTFIVI